MAGPLRVGGGEAGQFFLFGCFLKIKDILLKTKYQYWQCWQSRSLSAGLLQYFAKNMALLVQKLLGGKKL